MTGRIETASSWLTMPERIAGLAAQQEHSCESFAAAVKQPAASIRRWERFEDVPTLIELGELANALHVSKRFLCFGDGELVVGNRGEPALTDAAIRLVLTEACASESEAQAFDSYRQLASDTAHSRTFVLMFVGAWRVATQDGADLETAITRAMVIATQAHWLARAVAQGVRPVREHLRTRPPNALGSQARAEYVAAELHKLSGIKPPIEAMVLAVACGRRLVPTLDNAASKAEAQRQEQLGWDPVARVDGDALVLNGVLKVRAWAKVDKRGADLTDEVLRWVKEREAPGHTHERMGFGIAFLVGDGPQPFTMATLTEAGTKTSGQHWVQPALRDLAQRVIATGVYVVSDEWVDEEDRRGQTQRRRMIIVDVENARVDPPRRTYTATTTADGTLGAWIEDGSRSHFSDLLPAAAYSSSVPIAE